jgi:outer membrane protein
MPDTLDRRRSIARPARAALLAAVLALAVAGRAGAVSPADLRVGYIDSGRIFEQYKLAQESQQRFDRRVQGWRDEAAEKQKAVDALRAEVRDQSPILSATRRQEKEEQLQRAINEYERFIQDIWGPQGKAAQENQQATEEVVTQIRQVVEKIAGDKGLYLVFDSASGFLLYADKSLDLTADVLTELAARAAGTGPK